MKNNLNSILEEASIIKDIEEREKIINNYKMTGFINRDKAIEKIKELRLSDMDVAKVTSVKLAESAVPFDIATEDQIIGELIMQVEILKAKISHGKFMAH